MNPLFGMFLVNQLGIADRKERIQAFETPWIFPGRWRDSSACRNRNFLPPGPLATLRLDQQLLQLGLATVDELVQRPKEEEEPWKPRRSYDAEQDEEPKWVLTLAEKLRRSSTTSTRAFSTSVRGPCGPRASCCWSSTAISTSTSAARTF